MPYSSIYWVKLKLELLSDHRFIEECDDTDKLLFMGLLLLAGATQNKIPNNPKYIKRMLNLQLNEPEITQKIAKIQGLFKGFIGSSDFVKFKNFNELHNWYGSSKGVPRETQIRIDKNRIDKIVRKFITLKDLDKQLTDRPNLLNTIYKTQCKYIKQLLEMAKDDLEAEGAIDWVVSQEWSKRCDWGISTVVKKFPDYLRSKGNTDKWNTL